jgi:hypothetical protein
MTFSSFVWIVVDSIKGDASFYTCLQGIQEGMEASSYQLEYLSAPFTIKMQILTVECIHISHLDLALWDVEAWSYQATLKTK